MGMEKSESSGYKFDAVAVEALSAGIGLGTLVPKRKTKKSNQEEATKQEVIKEEQPDWQPPPVDRETPAAELNHSHRTGWVRFIFAYFIDLCIVSTSLLVAMGVVHFLTLHELPLPVDLLFAIASKFEPHQIVIGIASLLTGYFVLFKLLTGFTLGQAIVGGK